MQRLLTTAALVIAFVACNQPATTTVRKSTEAEEYAVLSAVIQTLFVETGKLEQIVISDQTGAGYLFGAGAVETLKFLRHDLPDLTDEVSADFQVRNEQPHALKKLLTIRAKYVYITHSEMETIFNNQDGWDAFYAKYPNSQGHMVLSRVGFSSQKDVALVYVGNQCHWKGGAGQYVLLKKVNGDWTVQGRKFIWFS